MILENRRSCLLWGMVALMCFLSAFVYDYYSVTSKAHHLRFGVTYMTMNNPFYPVIQNEMVKLIEGNQDQLILRDPMLDAQKQAEQIEEFIEMKVDGIFVNPVDSEKIISSLQKANEKGIPVVVIDCPLEESNTAISSISSDNKKAGKLWAQDLAEKYESGNIALLKHTDTVSGRDRIDGFREEIVSYPQFQIVNEAECYGQTELAMPAVLQILEETPDVDFILCLNDPSAVGAIAALDYLDRQDIQVYGVDGMPEFKEMLARQSSAQATVTQSPYQMADRAVETMYAWLNGKQVEANQIIDVALLDRSNIEKQRIREWQ